MPIDYFEGQTEEQRAEEIRQFKLTCPEYYDCPENLAVIKRYLSEKNLPILTDTLCAGFMLNRNNLIKKHFKFKTDDSNAIARSGRLSHSERQAIDAEETKKFEQGRAERNAARARLERAEKISEARSLIIQRPITGRIDHAATDRARKAALAALGVVE